MLIRNLHSSHLHHARWYNPRSPRVFVDADHINFVDKQLVTSHTSVQFKYYFAYGARFQYLQRVKHCPNIKLVEAPTPDKNMADLMICVDVAQTARDTPCIVVSRDKMLHTLTTLCPNVVYVSSKDQLIERLK